MEGDPFPALDKIAVFCMKYVLLPIIACVVLCVFELFLWLYFMMLTGGL